MTLMLQYARRHGVAEPPNYDLRDLCQGLTLASDEDLSLPNHELEFVHSKQLCREQLRITQKSAAFLATSITRPCSPALGSLKPSLQSYIDLPLERYRKQPLQSYKIPCSLGEAVIDWRFEQVEADDNDYPNAILDLLKSAQADGLQCAYEDLVPDDSHEQFLTTFHYAPELLDVDDIVIKGCSTSTQQETLHIEPPLLPLASYEPSSTLLPDLATCSVEDTTAADAKELQQLTLESFDSSSSYFNELHAAINLPETPVKLAPCLKLEIDSPLSPRRTTFQSVVTEPVIGCVDESMFNEFQPLQLCTSPAECTLEELFGWSTNDPSAQLFLKENLVDNQAALRIEEPAVPRIACKPDLQEYPTCVLDLLRAQTHNRANFVINAVPARHLDLDLRWNPFTKALAPIGEVEGLTGEELVDDYFQHEVPKSPVFGDSSDVLGQRTNLEQPTSPLACLMPKPYQSIAADSFGRESSQSSRATTSLSICDKSSIEKRTRTETPKSLTDVEHASKHLAMISCHFEEVRPSVPVISPGSRLLSGGRSEVPSRSSETIRELTCDKGHKKSIPPQLCSQLAQSNAVLLVDRSPGARQRAQTATCSSLDDDSAVSEPLQKRRRTGQTSVDQILDYKRIEIKDKIDLYMKMRGKEVSAEPQTPVRSISSIPTSIEPPTRCIIAPTTDNAHSETLQWIISINLLQLSSIAHVFCRQHKSLTLIERDLPQSLESDLIVSATTSIVLFRLEHVLGASLDNVLPSQDRIIQLLHKYDKLVILIVSKESPSESQLTDLVPFQGWLLSVSPTSQCITCTSETELTQYLIATARRYGGAQVESLQDDESEAELFLRMCPFVNAMVGQLILNQSSLFKFLSRPCSGKIEILEHVGVSDARAALIAQFFSTDWHADVSVHEPVIEIESDYMDAATVAK